MIPYGRQTIDDDDIAAVVRVLNSDFLTQGDMVPLFEARIADYCSVKNAIAVNSATSALHIACLAMGLGEGDWLWTTPITFVASANCARYCGANVDFVDIDPKTYNISIPALRDKLAWARENNRLPKIVVPVHMAGRSCEMTSIKELSKEYNFQIIEDASHALGGSYKRKKIGNCDYSDVTIFSFHPVKIITTGEGGCAVTNNDVLANKMRLLRSHGINKDFTPVEREHKGGWYYEQSELGFNYRLSDIHASLGLSQLLKVDKFVEKRVLIAREYNSKLAAPGIQLPIFDDDIDSSWHLYVVRLDEKILGISRDVIYKRMREKGISLNVHYIPVHTQPYYQALGSEVGYTESSYPGAINYYREALSLPIFPLLEKEDQEFVISSLMSAISK